MLLNKFLRIKPINGYWSSPTDNVLKLSLFQKMTAAQFVFQHKSDALSDANFAESLSKEAVKLRDELKVQDIADRWLEVI